MLGYNALNHTIPNEGRTMHLLHKTPPTEIHGAPATDRACASAPGGADGSPQHSPYHRPPVRFRPSAALGWAFIAFILATGPLEFAVADQSGSAYFSAAGLGAIAVISAIALTELRRARSMARAGLSVERIEIGFLRGRIVTSDEPSTPRDLRRISWAGPLALAASAAGLAAVGVLMSLAASPGLSLLGAAAVFAAMGIAALAVAELLPAPGSPGSQLIFARAWRRTGERGAAVLPTAKAGLVTGYALIAGGLAVALLLSFAGIWVMFVGGMVIAGSKLTMAGARTREQLSGVRARDVMSPAAPEVSSFATAEVALTDVALPSRASVLTVRESDGSFGGIVNVHRLAAVPGDDRAEVRVRRLAIPPDQVATVTSDQPMETVLEALARHPLGGVALVTAAPGQETGGREHNGPESGEQLLNGPTFGAAPFGSPRFVGIITTADVTRTLELMNASRPGRRRYGSVGASADNPYARP